MTKIDLLDKRIRYAGRIDRNHPEGLLFTWPGCLMQFDFIGTAVSVNVTNIKFGYGKFLGAVIDGKDFLFDLEAQGKTAEIAKDLENKRHTVVIYKRMEQHYFILHDVMIDGELCETDFPKRRIEVYGDSVSEGACADFVEYFRAPDPEKHDGSHDNSWNGYPLIMSRIMPAQVYVTAQGGIAILDKTGYFEMPELTGMESCYNMMAYSRYQPRTSWDFSFVPHVIIFAIGQNDANPNPDCLKDPEYYKKWTDRYIEMVNDIRSHAPKATVVFALTTLGHNRIWDDALSDIAQRLGGAKNRAYHLMYKNCGCFPGHPRIPDQEDMAREMTEFLNSLPESTWED